MKPIMKILIPSHPTYDQLGIICKGIADTVVRDHHKPDIVIGVARGGLMPAVHVSHCLHVPMVAVSYSSKQGNGDNKNHSNQLPTLKQRKILIVDDIADSGKTLHELVEYYKNDNDVETATCYYKYVNKIHEPTYYGYAIDDDFGWVIFPWEND